MLTDYLAYQKKCATKTNIWNKKPDNANQKFIIFKAGNDCHKISFQREVVDSLLLNAISK